MSSSITDSIPYGSPNEGALREHINYLREQLAGKSRWQEEEIKRLRDECKLVNKLRLALQEAVIYWQQQADCNKDDFDRMRDLMNEGL